MLVESSDDPHPNPLVQRLLSAHPYPYSFGRMDMRRQEELAV